MGWGDEIMSTGLARGAAARGKRAAFGDGKKIIWSQWCAGIFKGNPNIAPLGSEGAPDLEWHHHYKGHRLYVKHHADRWYFDRSWRVTPGEMFFDKAEQLYAESIPSGFILIEPRVKPVYPNKQWPQDRYRLVAQRLMASGAQVRQFAHSGAPSLPGIPTIASPSFRHGLAALSRAALYIGPEGGLSHGAAAVNVPAVVLFGGFPDPQVTGYPHHENLTGGVAPCGSIKRCQHCIQAMRNITVEHVWQSAQVAEREGGAARRMNQYEKALQIDGELDWFTGILKRENVRSYLEIGSKFGGSLWRVANSLPKGSRVVSVDMPAQTNKWAESKVSLPACVAELCARGYDARLLWGDSTDAGIVRNVSALGPFDACLIDANHTLPYIKKDWANYGPMARIVAFHDIAWKAHALRKTTAVIEVPGFWNSIKGGYRHEEKRLEPLDNGIGVLWRS